MGSATPSVTIYSRRECHLCDVVYRIARHIQQDVPFHLDYVEVDSNPMWVDRFGDHVPVLFIDGREICSGAITEGRLRRAIERARWRSPISRILSRLKLALTRG
jgi:glutaredoxin